MRCDFTILCLVRFAVTLRVAATAHRLSEARGGVARGVVSEEDLIII